jgi:formate dehydrogenase subunit delta
MTDGEAKLIRMALEIRQFFRHQGDDVAASAAANHLKQFWAPSMRQDFLALIEREGDAVALEVRAIASALKA